MNQVRLRMRSMNENEINMNKGELSMNESGTSMNEHEYL